MYVDESGDYGFASGSSSVFIRTGLIVHGRQWGVVNKSIVQAKENRNIPKTVEIHATEIVRGRSKAWVSGRRIDRTNWYGAKYPNKSDRLEILKDFCKLLKKHNLTLICIVIDKGEIDKRNRNYKDLPRDKSWELLIERYNKFLVDARDKKGLIIADAVQDKIEKKHREFARNLYEQSNHIDEYHFIESILFEPSDSSNLLQLIDIASYACGRKCNQNDDSLFNELKDSLLKKEDGSVDGAGYKCWP